MRVEKKTQVRMCRVICRFFLQNNKKLSLLFFFGGGGLAEGRHCKKMQRGTCKQQQRKKPIKQKEGGIQLQHIQ